ncbi:MAG: hypothetical protein CM15mP106_4590 [Candidatus Neomarinimicrobiota bacterium]|nr:MAG: hypothetical protein CM15mP106_4590 [Candidatus Neomarinimicrobiota bacterium]
MERALAQFNDEQLEFVYTVIDPNIGHEIPKNLRRGGCKGSCKGIKAMMKTHLLGNEHHGLLKHTTRTRKNLIFRWEKKVFRRDT